MSGVPPTFLDALRVLADALTPTVIGPVATAIASVEAGHWAQLRLRAQGAAGSPRGREAVRQFLDRWEATTPAAPPASVSLALETAARCLAFTRTQQTRELAWTGPASTIPLRRIAQALEQVIDEAERELLIVSYAVYRIPEVGVALARAVERGVRPQLVIESPKADDGHVAYDGLAAFGPAVRQRSAIYRWPPASRPKDANGKHGALHVKCAVADEHLLLLSSANLTDHALTLNMELGILVRGGEEPRQVARHFRDLMSAGVLVRANA